MRNRRGRNPDGGGIYDPNMTPLIDVSLVLVVILMVATPLAFQSGIMVNSATASGRAARDKQKMERIELGVMADGRVRVNKDIVARADLAAALKPLLVKSPSGLVVVRCDDTVGHGDFVSVIDEARGLGASKIAVVSD
jgi:biopolymer transport protein ExbD